MTETERRHLVAYTRAVRRLLTDLRTERHGPFTENSITDITVDDDPELTRRMETEALDLMRERYGNDMQRGNVYSMREAYGITGAILGPVGYGRTYRDPGLEYVEGRVTF